MTAWEGRGTRVPLTMLIRLTRKSFPSGIIKMNPAMEGKRGGCELDSALSVYELRASAT